MDGGDWLDFAASLLDTLIWPVVVVFIFYMLRGPIKSALTDGSLRRFKASAGGIEAEWFDRNMDVSQAAIEEEKAKHREHSDHVKLTDDVDVSHQRGGQRAGQVPDLTLELLNSYARLEQALRDRLNQVEPGERRARSSLSARAAAKRLVEEGDISESVYDAVVRLQDVRNGVAHGALPGLGPDDARRYVSQVNELLLLLQPSRAADDGTI